MTTQTLPPAERFAAILHCIGLAAMKRTGWSLTLQLIGLICTRLREIRWRFAKIAAQVQAGTYRPRRSTGPRSKPAARKPRQPGQTRQKAGWLWQAMPEIVVFRNQIENLLREPEMVALMAAAPTALRRPVRSLCHMLKLPPPTILALPKPAKPPPASAAGPDPPPKEGEAPPPPPPLAADSPGGGWHGGAGWHKNRDPPLPA